MSLKKSTTPEWQKPKVFSVKSDSDLKKFETLGYQNFYDTTELAIDELYDIEYPAEKDVPKSQKVNYDKFAKKYAWPQGDFAYLPWSQTLLRIPSKTDLRKLRTSRNRNLITAAEQLKLYDATIFIAGLSVGSNIVEALVSMGIGGKFVLADMDIIEPSNLNRIRAPYTHVSVHKADSIAMRMSEIDPYLDFELYKDGVTEKNLIEILDKHRPDVIIDEMDQLKIKIALRKEAKKRRMPVISAADNGDSALVDIERYDQDPGYPMLHGNIPEKILDYIENNDIPRQQLGMMIGKYFVGAKNIPLRMFESLGEVGKTLPSWPQLGGAATQSGVALAYATRKIVLNQPLRLGRFVIGPDQILDPTLDDKQHQAKLRQFQQMLEK